MKKTHYILSIIFCLSLCFAIISGCEDSSSNPAPETTVGPILFVANQAQGAGNLVRIDLGNNAVLEGAFGLGNVPNDIIQWENYLYVINSMSHDMNILEISDDFSVRQVDNVVLGRQENRIPQFGGVSDDGRLYISNLIDNTVTVMVYDHDADSARIQSYLSVGIAPADIEVIGDKIYVCNSAVEYPVYGQGSVSVIESNIESKRIPVGINAQFMALDPDGRLHVVCTGNYNDIAGKVYVIKTDIDAIAQVIELRGKPGDIAITSDGQAYVAAGGWAYNEDPFGVVYRYNAVTGEILNGPDNPIEVGLGASRVVIGEEGAVYVSCWDANRVDKIIGEERVDSYEVGTNPTPMLIFKP